MLQEHPPKLLRLFVAVQLPVSIRKALVDAQNQLRRSVPAASVSWTREENLHLTLRFLGPVAMSRVQAVKVRLEEAMKAVGHLELHCVGLGCFPNSRRPRVIWAGVSDGEEPLRELHRRVDCAVGEFARKPTETSFVGHVTLARVRQITRPDAERLTEIVRSAVGCRFGDWRCAEVELVSSELDPGGPRYTTLDVFPL